MDTGLKTHRQYNAMALAEVYRDLSAEAGIDTLPVFDRNFQTSAGTKRLVVERVANDPSFLSIQRTRDGDGFYIVLDFLGRTPTPAGEKADPWDTGLSREWRSLSGAFKGAVFVAHPLAEGAMVDEAFLAQPAVRDALRAGLKAPLPVCSFLEPAIVLHEVVRSGQIDRALALRDDPANFVADVEDSPLGVPANAIGDLAADLAKASRKGLQEVETLVQAPKATPAAAKPLQAAGMDAKTVLTISRIAGIVRDAGRPVTVPDLSLREGLDPYAVSDAVAVMTNRGWARLHDDDRVVLSPTMPDLDNLDPGALHEPLLRLASAERVATAARSVAMAIAPHGRSPASISLH